MRIQVIANRQCASANKTRLLAVLRERLNGHVMAVEETRSAQQATEVARRARRERIDTIVVVGGDGTLNGVINGIVGTDVAVGIVPAGTANDLACFHDVPHAVATACQVVLARHLERVDVINVNGWNYITAGGVGFPSAVAKLANAMKCREESGRAVQRTFGSHVYLLAALCQLLMQLPTRNRVKIRSDDRSLVCNPFALVVSNQPFLGKHFRVSPQALNNDGMFDICVIENLQSRTHILALLLKTLGGRHLQSPNVRSWRATNLVVEAEHPIPFFADGEIVGQAAEFRLRVLPRAINLITPEVKVAEDRC